ncbi:UNVERIFIED_CONTAM: hypothetical protein PYX00_001288 [Menopon gallinae]|uniref:Uncharacterized protein n=1 Tax=Menopon gallinae TaxID=328185 RepID=A0AAW2IC50_9NEOP
MIPDGFHLPVFINGVPLPPKPMHRPWPPVYRQQQARTGFCFRPQEPPPWRDYTRANGYREKGREYYYLAPLYRNALPPPPQPVEYPPPRRLMLLSPRSCPRECPCLHRSRSLEDVRSDLNSEWSEDESSSSAYRYDRKSKPSVLPNRRSLDDAVKVDPRRKGRYQDMRVRSTPGNGER